MICQLVDRDGRGIGVENPIRRDACVPVAVGFHLPFVPAVIRAAIRTNLDNEGGEGAAFPAGPNHDAGPENGGRPDRDVERTEERVEMGRAGGPQFPVEIVHGSLVERNQLRLHHQDTVEEFDAAARNPPVVGDGESVRFGRVHECQAVAGLDTADR